MALRKNSEIVYGGPPRVNLLPAKQRAELRHDRTMPILLLAIVLSALLAAGIWAIGLLPVQLADQRLAAAEAESQALITQIAEHSEEQQAINDVNKLSTARGELTAREVLFIDVLDEIDEVLPTDVAIESYSGVLQAPDVEGAAPSSGSIGMDLGPLCAADTATLAVTFVGPSLAIGAELINNLRTLTDINCAVATQTTAVGEDGQQQVIVQIALGEDALAGRFVEEEAAE